MKTLETVLKQIKEAFDTSTYSNSEKSSFACTFSHLKYDNVHGNILKITTLQDHIDSLTEEGFLLYALISNIKEDALKELLKVEKVKKVLAYSLNKNSELFALFKPEFAKSLLQNMSKYYSTYQMAVFSSITDFDKVTDEELRIILKPNPYSDVAYLDIFSKVFGDRVYSIFASLFEESCINLKGFRNKPDELIKVLKEVKMENMSKAVESLEEKLLSIDTVEKLCIEDNRYYDYLDSIIKKCYIGFENKAFECKDCNELFRYACLVAKCCNNKSIPTYIKNKLKSVAPLIKLYSFDYKQVIEALKQTYKENHSLQIKINNKNIKMYAFIDETGKLITFNSKEERNDAINKIKQTNRSFKPTCYVFDLKEDSNEK